jgi:hypothetical protein
MESDCYKAWLAEGRRLIADLPTESWDDRWISDDCDNAEATLHTIFFIYIILLIYESYFKDNNQNC